MSWWLPRWGGWVDMVYVVVVEGVIGRKGSYVFVENLDLERFAFEGLVVVGAFEFSPPVVRLFGLLQELCLRILPLLLIVIRSLQSEHNSRLKSLRSRVVICCPVRSFCGWELRCARIAPFSCVVEWW
jgi:hypothetical protein